MTVESLTDAASRDALLGVIVGLALGLALVALLAWRDSRRGALDAAPDWGSIFPSRYDEDETLLRRTETDAETEEAGKVVIIGLLGLLLAVAFLTVQPRLTTWLAFLAAGLGIGVAVGTLVLPVLGRHLAPYAVHATIRAGIVGALAGICLAWTLHTTYGQVSLAQIRHTVLGSGFRHKPSALNHAFHSVGWWLVVSLGIGVMLAVMAGLLAFWSALAALSMSRVGAGARGRFTMWVARFHTPRQVGLWVRAIVLMAVAFVLCSGAALHWTDPAKHIHLDLSPSSTKPQKSAAKTVTIPATVSKKVTASDVCGHISKLPVHNQTLLARLSATDKPALSARHAKKLRAATGTSNWFVTGGHHVTGVSCLYRVVGKPTHAVRISYLDSKALRGRTAAAKKAHARLVRAPTGGAELPPHAGSSMAAEVRAALPSIRYG